MFHDKIETIEITHCSVNYKSDKERTMNLMLTSDTWEAPAW